MLITKQKGEIMDLFEIFGIVLDWGFIVQVMILITLLYIAHDINKIVGYQHSLLMSDLDKGRKN